VDGLAPILVAIIGSAGTVLGALIGAGYLARRGRKRGQDDPNVAGRWREQADLEKARADLLDEQLNDEREARHAAIEANRGLLADIKRTRDDLDDCARQRDNAYATIRAIERRPEPRSPA
jgi:hypothetical protein